MKGKRLRDMMLSIDKDGSFLRLYVEKSLNNRLLTLTRNRKITHNLSGCGEIEQVITRHLTNFKFKVLKSQDKLGG